MTFTEALFTAAQSGISLSANDGRLQYEALPGRMTDNLRAALKENKPAIVGMLSALDADPTGPPYDALIEQAAANRLRLPIYKLCEFETVTDANRYILWALEQVRSGSHHRMACLAGLARTADAIVFNDTERKTETCPR